MSTLNGWTQSSRNWNIIPTPNKDTTIQYNFSQKDLLNLRLYILSLEKDRETNKINELIIEKQQEQIYDCEDFLMNKDSIISLQDSIIGEDKKINLHLTNEAVKYKKKANNWPYWLGGGFVGGILLCLILTK